MSCPLTDFPADDRAELTQISIELLDAVGLLGEPLDVLRGMRSECHAGQRGLELVKALSSLSVAVRELEIAAYHVKTARPRKQKRGAA